MPRSRKLLHKLGKQAPLANTPTPFVAPDPNKAWRNSRTANRSLTVYMLADRSQAYDEMDNSVEFAFQQERELSNYRAFRRELRHCEDNTCSCYCYCHSGNVCAIEDGTRRYHTHGHKPTQTLHTDTITGKREWRPMVCHDELTASQYHLRAR